MMVMLMVVGLGNGLRWVRERSRGKESGNGSRKGSGNGSGKGVLPHHTPQRARLFLGRLHPGGVIGSEEGQVLTCIAEVRLDIHAETTWPETHQLWTMKPSVVQNNCILKQRVRWTTFLSSPDSARTRNTQLHDSAIERRRRQRRCHGDDHDGDCTFLLFVV